MNKKQKNADTYYHSLFADHSAFHSGYRNHNSSVIWRFIWKSDTIFWKKRESKTVRCLTKTSDGDCYSRALRTGSL